MKVFSLYRGRQMLIISLVSLGFFIGVQAKALSPESIQSQFMKEIKKQGFKESELGLLAISDQSADAKSLFSLNENKKMTPASLSKICTAVTALHVFPPGFKFKTQILSNAPIKDHELKGNIWLKGGGDPGFVSETMWFLVNEFMRNEIKTITGDIIVDDTLFDQQRFDSSRESSRVDRAYDAPTGAMSFNWNSVNIFIRPGAKPGDDAKIFIDPENDYITLRGSVNTVKSGSTEIAVSRIEDKNKFGDIILVKGKISLNQKEKVIYKNITSPDLWAGSNLKSFLKQRGVEVQGRVRSGIAPVGANLLAEAEGNPIEKSVADMDKFSNNYIAEMLTKNMGAEIKKPGSIAGGMERIKKHLLGIGVDKESFDLQNPSGLTRDNKITPYGLWRVLNDAKNDFKVYPEFLSSLPLSGIDGTLKNRFKNSDVHRWVRAKTGLLTGVVGLAGYAGRPTGEVITFVFIYNGSGKEAKARKLFDQLAEILVL